MKRSYWIPAALAVLALTAAVYAFKAQPRVAAKTAANPATALAGASFVAGPGRVEPLSEDIKVGSELSGKLKQVPVEEGDPVHAGQVVAELENADYRAAIASAQATVQQRQAELRKVLNGARFQERRQTLATVEQNQAVLANAKAEMDRRNQLFAVGVISREEQERYQRQYQVALANYNEAFQHHSLVDDKPREEDRSAAESTLALAQAQLAEAQAHYQKTLIRSPIDGVVLRKHHRLGESVSNSSTVPDPIVTIGDNSVLRVRMDVDETDVARVQVGQPAWVTADAYGQQKFPGQVIRVGKELGRKNVRTDEPTERVDTKILEALIQLRPGVHIPVGLRVDAYVDTTARETPVRSYSQP